MGEPQRRGDGLAVCLAEVRAEVKALDIRFDSLGDLMDAKLAPLQKWMEGQVTVCSSHEGRLVALEGTCRDLAPTVRKHDEKLAKVEHVTANAS